VKQVLVVAAGVLLAGLIGWATVDFDSFRHTFAGYSDREIKQSWQEFDLTQAKIQQGLDRQLLEGKIKLAETRFGQGSLYSLCHEYEPTAKQNKAKCKQLDDRMARADAEYAKHPW
jgi:hypothetical protein